MWPKNQTNKQKTTGANADGLLGFLLGFGTTPGDVQGLSLSLHLGIIPGGAQGPYGIPGDRNCVGCVQGQSTRDNSIGVESNTQNIEVVLDSWLVMKKFPVLSLP